MRRDDELNRLVRYAQGMGLSVRFKPYVKGSGDAAQWLTDGTEVTIYVSPKDTKIGKILLLIHELGHHKGFIEKDRKINPELDEVLDSEDKDKAARKKVYLDELADSMHWEQIYKDTNCQFDINKLHSTREFDVWQYEEFYKNGEYPNRKEKDAKRKELKLKYKKGKNG